MAKIFFFADVLFKHIWKSIGFKVVFDDSAVLVGISVGAVELLVVGGLEETDVVAFDSHLVDLEFLK